MLDLIGHQADGVEKLMTELQRGNTHDTHTKTLQQANTLMEKAREIEKKLGSSHRIVDARGTMECDMVEYVLGKLSKADREKTSLNLISSFW